MEKLIIQNSEIIEEFSWVSAPIDGFEESGILNTYLNNHANYLEYPQDLHAIQPNYFATAES